jgi:hypothetical protein
MNRNHSMWIAVLTLSAVILGAVLLAAPPREANAAMLNAQAGYTLVTTGTPGGDEALVIVDKSTQKMLVYTLSGNTLSPMAGLDFGRLFTAR